MFILRGEILKDKQQKQSLRNGSSPNSFFRRLFMKCLLWKAFTLVYIPNLRNRRHYRKRNQIIDLLQIQLQPVEHRLQPSWELHFHHHRHHRHRRQHLSIEFVPSNNANVVKYTACYDRVWGSPMILIQALE